MNILKPQESFLKNLDKCENLLNEIKIDDYFSNLQKKI